MDVYTSLKNENTQKRKENNHLLKAKRKLNIKTSAKRYQFLHLACQEGDLTLPPSVKLLTSWCSKHQRLVSLPYQLSKNVTSWKNRFAIILLRAGFCCPNVASVQCSRPLLPSWKTKIYVWQFRRCAQFRCRWQAVIREGYRFQNAIFMSCTVHLKLIASWRTPDIYSLIWCWKRLYKPSNCFANNVDDDSIYSKLRAVFQ